MPKPKHLYRDIFKQAFIITYKNPFLWLLGLFITFLGVSSLYEIIFRGSANKITALQNLGFKINYFASSSVLIQKNFMLVKNSNWLLLTGAILLTVLILTLATWVSINSLGGIIYASNALDKNKKISLKESFNKGMGKFWSILAINISAKILILLFLFITGGLISLLLIKNSAINALLYFISFLIFVSVSLFLSFWAIYSSAFVMLKKNKITEAVHNAWELFKKNWVVTVEASVILFCFDLLIKFLIVVSVVMIAIPFIIFLLISFALSLNFLTTILLMLWSIVAILFLLFVSSFFAAYQIVAWILLFDRIATGGLVSKLHRIFRK